jgi:uncharacterized protein YbgA (DUF1722 family)/uncharacterized protein YbbK (DUF523 family)
MKIPVGISACVIGEKVRFDGSHKRARFISEELRKLFEFRPLCPEMAIGMGVPRPVIRQVQSGDIIKVVGSHDDNLDVTLPLKNYAEQVVPSLHDLCGYIVCAKSPSCGMERVKVYNEAGTGCEKTGVGAYTEVLMKKLPWLPVEEDGRLCDPLIRENFINRVYALHDYYQCMADGLTADKFVKFHSRYKLMLMATSPNHYRSLGKLVARIDEMPLQRFFEDYRLQMMVAMKQISTRKLHTNTLMHIQGYFKKQLDTEERQAFSRLILDYRKGEIPLLSPLTLVKHYLQKYPSAYLQQQAYLEPHPQHLKLRYGI